MITDPTDNAKYTHNYGDSSTSRIEWNGSVLLRRELGCRYTMYHYSVTLVSGPWPTVRELACLCDSKAKVFGSQYEKKDEKTYLISVPYD